MIPAFNALARNFSSALHVRRAELFAEIGWADLTNNPAYADTCAIRMSLALLKSGMVVPGRMRIKAGPHVGKLIEPGQVKLSHILSRRGFLGAPEKYKTGDAERGVGLRAGIVSFFDVDPNVQTRQGHIDIVSPHGNRRLCGTSCYWSSRDVWFWPLV